MVNELLEKISEDKLVKRLVLDYQTVNILFTEFSTALVRYLRR